MDTDANFYSPDLMKRLTALGRRVGCRSAIALLRRVTGSNAAGDMLLALLQWTPKSRKEGWIFKSWRDWQAELDLSRKQSNSAHGPLRTVGVEMDVRRAAGSPQMHYRVTVPALCAAIGALVGMSAEDVKNFVANKAQWTAPNGANQNQKSGEQGRNGLRQNAQSSTESTPSASRFDEQNKQHQQGGGENSNDAPADDAGHEGDGHSVNQMGAVDVQPPTPSSAPPLPPAVRDVPDLAAECAQKLIAQYGEDRVVRCAEAAMRGHTPAGLLQWYLAQGWYQDTAANGGERKISGRLSDMSVK